MDGFLHAVVHCFANATTLRKAYIITSKTHWMHTSADGAVEMLLCNNFNSVQRIARKNTMLFVHEFTVYLFVVLQWEKLESKKVNNRSKWVKCGRSLVIVHKPVLKGYRSDCRQRLIKYQLSIQFCLPVFYRFNCFSIAKSNSGFSRAIGGKSEKGAAEVQALRIRLFVTAKLNRELTVQDGVYPLY